MTEIHTPGTFFVVRTNGWAARGIRLVTDSDVNHACLYLGNGKTLEAQPHGAMIGRVSAYPDALWSDTNPALRISEVEGRAIIAVAMTHVGDRYSWVDCACIGVAKVFGHAVPAALRDRLSDPHMNMCSQLVDRCYSDAGIHLFSDGRLPGNVSPGDLRALITAVP